MSNHIIARGEAGTASTNRQDIGPRLQILVQRNLVVLLAVTYGSIWLLFSIWHSIPFASLETDGMEYIATARSLFTAQFSFSSYHGLGFPLAIWLVHWIVPDWFIAARVVSGMAGLVLVLGTLRLVETIWDRTSATFAAILVIANFFVIAYSGMAMADMLGAAFGLIAPIAILTSNRLRRYAWAGAFAGLAALTRYQFFGLAGASVLALMLEKDNRSRIQATGLYLGAFFLAVFPLLALNWLTFGNPLFNSNFTLVGAWINTSPNTVPIDSWGGIANAVKADPRYVIFRYLKKVGFDVPLFLVHVVYYSIFFTIPGWLWAALRPDTWKKVLVPTVFGISYVLVTSIGWLVSERYWLFVIPFIAGGVGILGSQLSENRSRVGLALMAVLVLINLAAIADNLPHYAAEQAAEFKRAADTIYSQTGTNEVLLVSQPQIGYLADRPNVLYRDVPQKWTDLADVVAKYGIGYVEMDERYGTGHYPDLVKLLDPQAVSQTFPNWQLIYNEIKSPRIVVYRVNGK